MRSKSEDGAAALLEMRRDVDDKRGADGSVDSGVEDFEGAVRFALEWQLLEPSEKAAFVTECGGVVVVGVAGFPVRENDDTWTQFADNAGDFEPVFQGVGDCAVGQVEGLAMGCAENAAGLFGFGGAFFGRPAGAGLALGQV